MRMRPLEPPAAPALAEPAATTPFSGMTMSHRLFVYLCAVFVTCLLLGDVIGGKTIGTPLGPISVGMVPFPVTFLLTDIINDFYGRKGAHFLTILGFWMAVLAWIILQLSTRISADESTYFTQPEFVKIFGGSAQLFVASILAYLIGQLLDIRVFQFWKALTESRHLWLRATGSTVLSQVVDTVTINVIFWRWTADKSWGWILQKIGREFTIKVAIAVLLTPAVYALHGLIVRGLGIAPEAHERRR
jgi:queuosine precursor transporter